MLVGLQPIYLLNVLEISFKLSGALCNHLPLQKIQVSLQKNKLVEVSWR